MQLSSVRKEGKGMQASSKQSDQRPPLALASTCKPCLGLADKHTPFTWVTPVMTLQDCTVVEDKLCLLGTPWAVLVNRLYAAYSYFCQRQFTKGRSALALCYEPLLPISFFDSGCSIIQDHQAALRHVLDASWAAMGQMEHLGQLCHHDPDASWRAFTKTITPYAKLGRKQQAAVVAIRAALEDDTERMRKAIALNPNEGEWHYKLGYIMAEERVKGPSKRATREEISTLRRGLALRVNPDTLTRLARSVADTGPAGVAEAIKLMEEAMERYPDNVRVLWVYGNAVPQLYKDKASTPADRTSKALVSRCLELVGEQCSYVLFKMGVLHMYSKGKEADQYFERALAVNYDATLAAQEQLLGAARRFADERDAKAAAEGRTISRKLR